MFTSAARKKLQTALAATTDPAEITRLTAQLTRLLDAEGRARGRRQRQKAKAQAAAAKPAPADDSNEPFFLEPWTAPLTKPNLPAPKPEPEPEAPAPAAPRPRRPRPVNGAGWSRTLQSWEAPVWWDARAGCYVGATETGAVPAQRPEYSPESPELCGLLESTGRLTFQGGQFVNPAAEKRAEDAELKAYGDKMFGR